MATGEHPVTPSEPRLVVSIVIPMFNEREGLQALFNRLSQALDSVKIDWELVVVDDGSTDGTREAIGNELARFACWQFLILSRNFGQQSAYRAGLDAARGDAVIFLDADLQDPPELIPQLVEQWRAGYKVVTAVRSSRAETGPRRWAFDLFHRLFHSLTDGMMPRNSGMFALVDRVVADRLIATRETNLFIPALKCWFGFPQTVVSYARENRAVGAPKQSFRKLFNYALNGIISFSDKPLQWIGLAGLAISLMSFAYGAALFAIKVAQWFGLLTLLEVKGFTTLAVAVFGLSGIQLLCLGIIGQYLARIYREIKNRPLYVLESIQNSGEPRRIHQPGRS